MAASLHCRLEVLPGFDFLSCCDHLDAPETPAHHDSDCGPDGCASVESGFYKISSPQTAPGKPLLALVAWVIPSATADEPLPLARLAGDPSAPPELPPAWRFALRTALSPRAPALVS